MAGALLLDQNTGDTPESSSNWPTICPAGLISDANPAPSGKPESSNGSLPLLAQNTGRDLENPTICPCGLMLAPLLPIAPGKVPRSIGEVWMSGQKAACLWSPKSFEPTARPE